MSEQMTHKIIEEGGTRHPSTSVEIDHGSKSAGVELTPHSFVSILSRMTSEERVRAYRHGTFTYRELNIWAARYPDEVPLLNGEFEWISRSLADLD